LTSVQFFAQRRRQLIARPQATQGLLGKAALLPRKPAGRLVREAMVSTRLRNVSRAEGFSDVL
jgi:hypothetical protein